MLNNVELYSVSHHTLHNTAIANPSSCFLTRASLATIVYVHVLCRIIDTLSRVCKEYHTRIGQLEDEKFDLEYIVKRKDMEVERWAINKWLIFVELTTLTKSLIL